MPCPTGDSRYSTGFPPPPGRWRAERANSTEITGSRLPCVIAIGSPGRSRSRSKPSTSGMNPLMASSPAGDGRPAASANAYDITDPSEKPPITVRSHGMPVSSAKASSHAVEHLVGPHERLPVRKADPLDDVPVKAARRQRQRPARSRAHQPALGVELVQQREQVRLVHTAAVQQHERTLRLPGRWADAVDQQAKGHPTCSPAPRRRADRAPGRSRAGSRRRGPAESSSSAGSAPTTRQSR